MSKLNEQVRDGVDMPAQDALVGVCRFRDAEEMIFWYFTSLQIRRDGWSHSKWRHGSECRPIEIADFQRAILHGLRRRYLKYAHLAVLNKYGEQGLPPVFGYRPEMDREAELWGEAVNFLTIMFRGKNVLDEDGANDAA